MMVVETLTLLSTLPTLWRTPVAISAMPASREATMRSFCAAANSACALSLAAICSRNSRVRSADAVLEVVVGVLQRGVSPLQLGLGPFPLMDLFAEQTVLFGEEAPHQAPCSQGARARTVSRAAGGDSTTVAGSGLCKSPGSRTRRRKDLTCPHRPPSRRHTPVSCKRVLASSYSPDSALKVAGQHGLEDDGTGLQHQNLGRTQPSILDQAGLDSHQPGVRLVREDFRRRHDKRRGIPA